MRILILDAGRGIGGAKVSTWRERLGLEPGDDVALLSWHTPAEPLPLVAHLVAGPALHLGAEPRRVQTRSEAVADGAAVGSADDAGRRAAGRPGAAEGDENAAPGARSQTGPDTEREQRGLEPGATSPSDGSPVVELPVVELPEVELPEVELPLDDSQGDEEISEQFAGRDALAVTDADVAEELRDQEQLAADAQAEADLAVNAAARVAQLPKQHPRRLAHGLRWRTNRVRLQVRGSYRRGTRRAQHVTAHAPSRAVRSLLRMRGSGLSNEFALAVARSRKAADLFAGADVVVPVDDISKRAAWVLAQREAGPHVVVTFHAAARRIAQVRSGELPRRLC